MKALIFMCRWKTSSQSSISSSYHQIDQIFLCLFNIPFSWINNNYNFIPYSILGYMTLLQWHYFVKFDCLVFINFHAFWLVCPFFTSGQLPVLSYQFAHPWSTYRQCWHKHFNIRLLARKSLNFLNQFFGEPLKVIAYWWQMLASNDAF